MMARSARGSNSKAGYIDARPQSRQIDESSCDARPDHVSDHGRCATSYHAELTDFLMWRTQARRDDRTPPRGFRLARSNTQSDTNGMPGTMTATRARTALTIPTIAMSR